MMDDTAFPRKENRTPLGYACIVTYSGMDSLIIFEQPYQIMIKLKVAAKESAAWGHEI